MGVGTEAGVRGVGTAEKLRRIDEEGLGGLRTVLPCCSGVDDEVPPPPNEQTYIEERPVEWDAALPS